MIFDEYSEKTIELMVKYKLDQYLKLMGNADIPAKNKLSLLYYKIKEIEEKAKQDILSEATLRRAKMND